MKCLCSMCVDSLGVKRLTLGVINTVLKRTCDNCRQAVTGYSFLHDINYQRAIAKKMFDGGRAND